MQALAHREFDEDMPASAMSFASCYAAHYDKVFRLGLRYGGGNAAWAEDLTHDVFVKLGERLSELTDLDNVGGWIYRVATNLAISKLRRERSFWGRITSLFNTDDGDTVPGADVLFEERELADRAMASLSTLPPKERVVLAMKILDGKSQKEIAEALSLSESYVSKLVARALKTLKAQGWEVSSC